MNKSCKKSNEFYWIFIDDFDKIIGVWQLFKTSKNTQSMREMEKKIKGSLDSIQSPSPSRQQKFVDNTHQCFALLPQVNFPGNNLNFQ